MKQLICTGDSLAAMWPSGARQIIKNDEFFEYHNGGAGIDLQIWLLLNHYLAYPNAKDYIVISQFTGMNRLNVVLEGTSATDDEWDYKNSLTGTMEKVANHAKKHTYYKLPPGASISGERKICDLVAVHCMLADLGADVRVFRGWLGVMPPSVWEDCCRKYDKHGVSYTNETYVETALNIDANPEAWLDEFHPGFELAKKTIYKILEALDKNDTTKY